MLELSLPFRRATRNDCRQVAELIEIAGEGVPTWFWTMVAEEGQLPIDVGMARAFREDTNFSYRNAVFLEENGAVAAMLLGYKLPESSNDVNLEDYPAVVRPFVELEMEVPGSFYINALATYPQYRNRGYGSRLLEKAHELAVDAGSDTLSIEVYEQNEGAVRLYKRHGFKIKDCRPVIPHPSHYFSGDIVLLTCPVMDERHAGNR